MKLTRSFLALVLSFSLSLLSFVALPDHALAAVEASAALQRGYRTGYSDGYMAGYRDVIDKAPKDFARHHEYVEANRAYNKDYGSLEDYRDGYQQGFESGYDTGFEKRTFDSVVPPALTRRGPVNAVPTSSAGQASTPSTENPAGGVESIAAPVTEPVPSDVPAIPQPPVDTVSPAATTTEPPATEPTAAGTEPPKANIQKVAYQPSDEPVIIIPRDTELILELQEALDTERNREGDKFTAKVLAPQEIVGAIVEGRVDKVQKPGRIKKRSAMLLSFDKIIISDTRWSNFDAILTEVLPAKGDNVKRVDPEGAAIGKSTVKPDLIKVGAATGTGTVIGAIAGGPVGAAVGAGVGAAFGVGAVVIERGKHINLRTSQQLRVKTSYEAQIR
jgi:hypothetical protein